MFSDIISKQDLFNDKKKWGKTRILTVFLSWQKSRKAEKTEHPTHTKVFGGIRGIEKPHYFHRKKYLYLVKGVLGDRLKQLRISVVG